jgi:hypothetical protein
MWLESLRLAVRGEKMMRTTRAVVEIPCAIWLIFCIAGTAFAADQIPNIKGKWVGKTHSIVAGVAPFALPQLTLGKLNELTASRPS